MDKKLQSKRGNKKEERTTVQLQGQEDLSMEQAFGLVSGGESLYQRRQSLQRTPPGGGREGGPPAVALLPGFEDMVPVIASPSGSEFGGKNSVGSGREPRRQLRVNLQRLEARPGAPEPAPAIPLPLLVEKGKERVEIGESEGIIMPPSPSQEVVALPPTPEEQLATEQEVMVVMTGESAASMTGEEDGDVESVMGASDPSASLFPPTKKRKRGRAKTSGQLDLLKKRRAEAERLEKLERESIEEALLLDEALPIKPNKSQPALEDLMGEMGHLPTPDIMAEAMRHADGVARVAQVSSNLRGIGKSILAVAALNTRAAITTLALRARSQETAETASKEIEDLRKQVRTLKADNFCLNKEVECSRESLRIMKGEVAELRAELEAAKKGSPQRKREPPSSRGRRGETKVARLGHGSPEREKASLPCRTNKRREMPEERRPPQIDREEAGEQSATSLPIIGGDGTDDLLRKIEEIVCRRLETWSLPPPSLPPMSPAGPVVGPVREQAREKGGGVDPPTLSDKVPPPPKDGGGGGRKKKRGGEEAPSLPKKRVRVPKESGGTNKKAPPASGKKEERAVGGQPPPSIHQEGSEARAPPRTVNPPPPGNTWASVVGRKKGKEPKKVGGKEQIVGARGSGAPPATRSGGGGGGRKLPNTAAVTIAAINRGYGDIIKTARSAVGVGALREMGISELRTRKSITGAYVLEIPGGTREEREGKAEALAQKLQGVLGSMEGVRVSCPTKMAQVRVRDLDESISPEDIVQALTDAGGGNPQSIRVGRMATAPNGMGAVVVHCPLAVANKVAARGRLTVGWAACRVAMMEARPLQCFRCLELGHVQQRCPGPVDRSKCCYRCGVEGHIAANCRAEPKCAVCAQAGRPAAHRVGAACEMGKKGIIPPPRRRKASPKRGSRGGTKIPVREGGGKTQTPPLSGVLGPLGGDFAHIGTGVGTPVAGKEMGETPMDITTPSPPLPQRTPLSRRRIEMGEVAGREGTRMEGGSEPEPLPLDWPTDGEMVGEKKGGPGDPSRPIGAVDGGAGEPLVRL